MKIIPFLALFALSALAIAQTAPRPATTRGTATTSPVTAAAIPKNLDRTLQDPMKIDAQAVKLSDFARMLSDITQTNVVFNWNALGKSGITRETPVTLHLKEVPYEQVIRTLLEILPAENPAARANFIVADNTLEVTTNAELGKGSTSKIYDLSRTMSYTFQARATGAELENNRKLVETIVRAELARAGEPLDIKGHEILSKETTFVATISPRGLTVIDRALGLLAQPAKIGQLPPGIQMTASAKRADTALKALLSKLPSREAGTEYITLAREPRKFADTLNIALLPGTAEELAKPAPQIAHAITDGGVLLLGPIDAIRARTIMGVYDLRDLIRKIAVKSGKNPPPDAVQEAVLQTLHKEVKPEGFDSWGTLETLAKQPAALAPYNGILVVFATQDAQRMLAGRLQEMNK